jgi:hypothetical protein
VCAVKCVCVWIIIIILSTLFYSGSSQLLFDRKNDFDITSARGVAANNADQPPKYVTQLFFTHCFIFTPRLLNIKVPMIKVSLIYGRAHKLKGIARVAAHKKLIHIKDFNKNSFSYFSLSPPQWYLSRNERPGKKVWSKNCRLVNDGNFPWPLFKKIGSQLWSLCLMRALNSQAKSGREMFCTRKVTTNNHKTAPKLCSHDFNACLATQNFGQREKR